MEQLATARFAFAPRGRGASSYRLYEAMMVGTVPIAVDIPDYPFDDIVDWDSFAVRTVRGADFTKLLDGRDEVMRPAAAQFWDKYVRCNAGHRLIVDQIEQIVQGEQADVS